MVRRHDGVRDRRYKLIHWYGDGTGPDGPIDSWELYDLKKDPVEVNNVYNDPKYSKVRDKLHAALEEKRKELDVAE